MPKEPRTIDIGSQGPRKPPMQCWGCKGDHRFKDCSQRGEKGRVVHTVQQAKTMENMGRYVSRIEVEGMINNQTIVILIDSGASHSYVDPKMVESLQLPRRRHGKS
jgi:hypothetical protein